jgi:alpha/beta superfamily hydrolase
MEHNQVMHEQIRFGRNDYLAGVLSYPVDGAPTRAVLMCSPHPNFGGDLENNVVAALAERLAADTITLRFNYRGVGQSHIDLPPGLSTFDYWENVEQALDYAEPLADTATAAEALSLISAGLPMISVGYSFGAIMGTRVAVLDRRIIAMVGISPPLKRVAFEHLADCHKPCLLISGRDDFVYDADVAKKVIEASGPKLTFERPLADHFFLGIEAELAERVARFVNSASVDLRLPPASVDGSK